MGAPPVALPAPKRCFWVDRGDLAHPQKFSNKASGSARVHPALEAQPEKSPEAFKNSAARENSRRTAVQLLQDHLSKNKKLIFEIRVFAAEIHVASGFAINLQHLSGEVNADRFVIGVERLVVINRNEYMTVAIRIAR
jgi:hypothetical protein